jgi:hypothetical protein
MSIENGRIGSNEQNIHRSDAGCVTAGVVVVHPAQIIINADYADYAAIFQRVKKSDPANTGIPCGNYTHVPIGKPCPFGDV